MGEKYRIILKSGEDRYPILVGPNFKVSLFKGLAFKGIFGKDRYLGTHRAYRKVEELDEETKSTFLFSELIPVFGSDLESLEDLISNYPQILERFVNDSLVHNELKSKLNCSKINLEINTGVEQNDKALYVYMYKNEMNSSAVRYLLSNNLGLILSGKNKDKINNYICRIFNTMKTSVTAKDLLFSIPKEFKYEVDSIDEENLESLLKSFYNYLERQTYGLNCEELDLKEDERVQDDTFSGKEIEDMVSVVIELLPPSLLEDYPSKIDAVKEYLRILRKNKR